MISKITNKFFSLDCSFPSKPGFAYSLAVGSHCSFIPILITNIKPYINVSHKNKPIHRLLNG